jgi:hypothetical protein
MSVPQIGPFNNGLPKGKQQTARKDQVLCIHLVFTLLIFITCK